MTTPDKRNKQGAIGKSMPRHRSTTGIRKAQQRFAEAYAQQEKPKS